MANPFFNAAYYLAHNADVAQAVAGLPADRQFAIAEQHYDLHGASEGRAPNAWFDAVAYLNANPDLTANGVTVATALAHYAAYGWDEGRLFSNDLSLAPSRFTAADYAAANPDVAAALGIADSADPTPDQQNLLLSHYLAHGISEARSGAGPDFAVLIAQSGFAITEGRLYIGTVGNDLFLFDAAGVMDPSNPAAADLSNVSINGAQGADTLRIVNAAGVLIPSLLSVEHVSVAAVAASGLTAAGVQALTVTGGQDFVYTGGLLNALSYDGGVFTGVFSGVDGTRDALTARLSAETALTINGVEMVGLTLGTDTGVVYALYDNHIQGSALDIHVDGGEAGAMQILDLDSIGSAHLASVTVDAAAVASDLEISYIGDLTYVKAISIATGAGADCVSVLASAEGAVVSLDTGDGDDCIGLSVERDSTATIRAGAGDDIIVVLSAAHSTVTVDAGAGSDIIAAGAGIDILTGGAGADLFDFIAGTALVQTATDAGGAVTLTGFDTVTDFKNVTDETSCTCMTEFITVDGLAAAATGTYAGVGIVGPNGVIAFETGFTPAHPTLQSILVALNGAIGTEGDGVIFSFGGNAYVWMQGANDTAFDDDSLIQLTGVNADLLEIDGGDVVFA